MKEQLLNPNKVISELLVMNGYPEGELTHVKYQEGMIENDVQIIRQSTHDGTFLFTKELMFESVKPLILMTLYSKRNISEENLKEVKSFNYTVGDLKLETTFNDPIYPTKQTDKVTIPVKVEYIFS